MSYNTLIFQYRQCDWKEKLERLVGIEPTTYPWQGHVLPLNYRRTVNYNCFYILICNL